MSWSIPTYFRHYATPVSRDGFYHSGDSFYVKVDQNRHERSDGFSLYRLLTYTTPPPVMTKAGKVAKRQPPPHKDPPAHFYVAQLQHYGLPSLKTKEAAKKRLLSAFSSNQTIAVPQRILDLEQTLKQEYAHANVIAKKAHEENKRKQEIDDAKKRKKAKEERDAIMREFTDAPEQGTLAGTVARSAAQLAVAALPETKLRQIVIDLVDDDRELQRAVMNAAGPSEQKSGRPLSSYQKMGKFNVVAPYLSEQWEDSCRGDMSLKMSESSTGSHLWASFDFGVLSGIIRSTGAPPDTVGETIPVLFRGRESAEGEMTYGDDEENQGTLTFMGDGKIKGRLGWMGGFDFVGKKVDERNIVWVKSVRRWKDEWRGYNAHSYGRESRSRWGAWGGDDDDGEGPALSDTTEGGDNSDDESQSDPWNVAL